MRGQPKRLSRGITWAKMAGKSFYMFWFRFMPEMFSALSVAFLCSRAFRLFFCSFGYSLFCRLFGFRELNKANFNGNGNECDDCVSVRYLCSFLCRCLQKFTKHQHEIATFYIFERKWAIQRPSFKNSLQNFEAILHILTYSDSIDKLNEFNFLRDS